MDVLIFKTNIRTKKKIKVVKPVFNNNPVIIDWSIDTKDIDNVLRIESKGSLNENDVVNLVRSCGFFCEVLSD